MSDSEEPTTSPAIRASDAERDRTMARLQHHYAVGRLSLPELEERVAVACAARTRGELDALLGDLPPETRRPARSAPEIDPRLMIILLCCSPPAALVYWLIRQGAARRRDARRRARGSRLGRWPDAGLGRSDAPRGTLKVPAQAAVSPVRDRRPHKRSGPVR